MSGHGHPFEFIFGGPPDPEQQAQMQRAHDTAVMQQQSLRHEVQSFVDDLNEDGLRVLRAIVHAAAGDENYGAFVQGAITTMLHIKYSLCAACGENHDRALLGGAGDPAPTMRETDDGQLYLDRTPEAPVDDGTEQPAMFDGTPAEIAAAQADLEIENMKRWDLRYPQERDYDAGLEVGEGERPVFCNGCGMLYQSLADRMLRAPGVDGCQGCQHKAAHG